VLPSPLRISNEAVKQKPLQRKMVMQHTILSSTSRVYISIGALEHVRRVSEKILSIIRQSL
jgi:hypothetical protein